MRRQLRPSFRPQKQFIHTYHINEVPLPYYNPLEDRNLRHFFSNRNVSQHIKQVGLIYEPSRKYPYQQRRTKNAYKFHRQNSPDVPSTHLVQQRGMSQSVNLRRSKIHSGLFEMEEPVSPILKRKAESEILMPKPGKGLFLADIMARNRVPITRRKVAHSSEGRSRADWSNRSMQGRNKPDPEQV